MKLTKGRVLIFLTLFTVSMIGFVYYSVLNWQKVETWRGVLSGLKGESGWCGLVDPNLKQDRKMGYVGHETLGGEEALLGFAGFTALLAEEICTKHPELIGKQVENTGVRVPCEKVKPSRSHDFVANFPCFTTQTIKAQ